MLKRIKPMRVSRDENVDVELSLDHRQTVGVAPRHHLVAVTQTDTEAADRHHLLLGVVQVLTAHNFTLSPLTMFFLFTGECW